MITSLQPYIRRASLALASLLVLCAGPAVAQVFQPTGEAMPQPPNQDEINNVIVPRGFPPDAVTLEGLFRYRGEYIGDPLDPMDELDPVEDARTSPGAFSPLCGFTGELVLRGGACNVAFGWYNVDDPGTIYELIPQNVSEAYQCQDNDFCPLATMDTTQVGQHTWVPRTFSAESIRSDPNYHGGLVGFAQIGNPDSQCTQTKYSEPRLNVQCTSCSPAAPWVAALIYPSIATPDAFYIAFEDLPMSPTDWRGTNAGVQNDGDFNDFVYFVTGLTCKGGGQPCETGLHGACSIGRTDCGETGETTVCRPVTQRAENDACDNLDNDCDGTVDEDPCPQPNQVCSQGVCVNACSSDEFPCALGLLCENGHCIDPLCAGIACDPGLVCRGGSCVGACDGVVCPRGQECQLGRCVDLCRGVTCPDGRVCERGLCLASCDCRTCPEGTACSEVGERRCVEAGCESVECPQGQVCIAGACADACSGVVCPGGASCDPATGQCGEPVPGGGAGTGGTGTGGIVIGPGTGATSGFGATSGGGNGNGNGGTSGGSQGSAGAIGASDAGCGCRTTGGRAAGGGLIAALGLVLMAARRRRAAEPRRR